MQLETVKIKEKVALDRIVIQVRVLLGKVKSESGESILYRRLYRIPAAREVSLSGWAWACGRWLIERIDECFDDPNQRFEVSPAEIKLL